MADRSAPAADTASAKGQVRVEELTAAERSVARRAAQSRATVPDLELSADVEMSGCLALATAEGVSMTAMLVKACAHMLREVPRANASYRDGHFELYSRVNVGFVVAGENTYVLPTLFDADEKPLAHVSQEIEQLSAEAERGQLPPPAYAGATFTLGNFDTDGVVRAGAIVNPPQAAALAAGAIREVPVVRAGNIVVGHLMTMALACDHRILYGAEATRFLIGIKSMLEEVRL